MDAIDRQIVQLLQADGRLTHEQISKEVHLSRPAVYERVRRMEAHGVIRGYTARLDWDQVGLPLTAFIWIQTAGRCLDVGRHILTLSTPKAVVEACHRVAGEWCLMVQTRSASSLALQELLDGIMALDNVKNTMTTVALSEVAPLSDGAQLPNPAGSRA